MQANFFQWVNAVVKIVHNKNNVKINNQTSFWNVLRNEFNSSLILDDRDKIVIELLTSNNRPNLTTLSLPFEWLKSINDTSTP